MANKTLLLVAFVLVLPPVALAQNGPTAIPQGGDAPPYVGAPIDPVCRVNRSIPSPEAFQTKLPYRGRCNSLFPDAVRRGLKQNMGALLSSEAEGSARGERWWQPSNQLPHFPAALAKTSNSSIWRR